MATIYLVEAYGGQYDDRWEYIEKVFDDEVIANDYVNYKKTLNQYLESIRDEVNQLFTKMESLGKDVDLERDFTKFITTIKTFAPEEYEHWGEDKLKEVHSYYIVNSNLLWGDKINYRIIPKDVENNFERKNYE